MSTEVPGSGKPLRRWEYYYWGLGVSAVSYFLYRNLAKPEETQEQIEVRGCRLQWLQAAGICLA